MTPCMWWSKYTSVEDRGLGKYFETVLYVLSLNRRLPTLKGKTSYIAGLVEVTKSQINSEYILHSIIVVISKYHSSELFSLIVYVNKEFCLFTMSKKCSLT